MDTFGGLRLLVACVAFLTCAGVAHATCDKAPDLGLYQAPPAPIDPAAATQTPASASVQSASGPTGADRIGRMVAPVTINGQGPFRFIIDTGANRSVVSNELALHLGLAELGTGEVHSVHGVSTAPLVSVENFVYGALPLGGEQMPVLGGAVLAGEQGVLGVDGMRDRRLMLDFERRCIEIVPSRSAHRLPGWAVIRGQLKFGTLVVVRGSINGLHVNLLLDTGSDVSLANEALRNALNAHVYHDHVRLDYAVAYAQGRPVILENAILIPQMAMGELEIRSVTAYVGNFHIFELWDLLEEPTLLIGMDVLQQTRGMAIDYGRRTVALHIRDALRLGTRLEN
jgi:predicted aspartyl protease